MKIDYGKLIKYYAEMKNSYIYSVADENRRKVGKLFARGK